MLSTMEAPNMTNDPTPQSPALAPWAHPMRVADLAQRTETKFSIIPSAAVLKAIAADIDVLTLKKMRFEGKLSARGKTDWALVAKLGATVTQNCVVTLVPVNTRVDVPVQRVFIADHSVFEGEPNEDGEIEMHTDETREPLQGVIDLGEIMLEALALAVPLYPRADGAALESAQFTAPGTTPMQDEDARPFAGLANLLKTGDKPDKK
ncbi:MULTISPECIES: YceD family protein [Falsihalocynthiibacter]|uniref:YceD family protein n=2 Tax=Roseobacteraceae TaxID=2854170 RepID=UPI003002CB60